MEKEIKEMGKFACIVCEMCYADDKGGFYCDAGVNQDVCGLCQDLGRSFYDAGYRKPKVKTIGDKIRRMSDEELAKLFIRRDWDFYNNNSINPCNGGQIAVANLANKTFYSCDVGNIETLEELAFNANLEWLKKEHKGE